MGIFSKKIRHLFLPLFGLFFATQLIFATTPVLADPDPQNQTTSQTASSENCYNQLGGIGWLLCPAINVSSNAIDAIYNFITGFLVVNPAITSDTSSPIYVVWEYVRNITNIVFIIFLLISIYSQITGFGISNYGIKRVLPRIIISALLVNLSFVVCALAVDLSNILGISFFGFFESVRASTVGSTTAASAGEITAVILGGGTVAGAGVAVAAAAGGGFVALLFAAIPIILGGLISIIIALICIMLRQGIIALLIMIAPAAFVAYLLPNTEKWFVKWRNLLVRMLVFYPLFAILFGASSLTSGAIIASSNGDAFWGLVGLAVQILPLFLAWSLLKFSGTVLGTISDKLHKLSQPATAGVGKWADSHRQVHKSRYLAEPAHRFNLPRRARQGLDRRRFRRDSRAATYQALQKGRNEMYVQQHSNKRDLAARDAVSDITSVNRHLQLAEVSDRYRRSHDAIANHAKGRVTARYTAMQSAAGSTGQQGINSIVSGAIASQAKAAKEALGDYESLYENAVFSSEIYDELDAAFVSKNPIAARAALSVLAKRGEYDTITNKLREHTPSIKSDDPIDRAMQQSVADVMFTISVADTLKGYGKSIAKSRNKANMMNRNRATDDQLPTFFDFNEYENPAAAIADPARYDAIVKSLNTDLDTILRTNNNANVAAVQDKTVWDDAKGRNTRLFTPSQLRYAIFNEPTDGATYQYMIDAQLGVGAKWQDKDTRHILTFRNTAADPDKHLATLSSQDALREAQQHVAELMSGINTNQLSKFTPDAFEAFTTIFSGAATTAPDGTITFDNSDPTIRRQHLVAGLRNLSQYFPDRLASDLRKQGNQGRLGSMNPEIRSILNEVMGFEQ